MCAILLWKKKNNPLLFLSSPFSALYSDKPCGSYLIKCGLLWSSIFAWFQIAAICNWCDQFSQIYNRHKVFCKEQRTWAVATSFQLPAGQRSPRMVLVCPVWILPNCGTTSPAPGTIGCLKYVNACKVLRWVWGQVSEKRIKTLHFISVSVFNCLSTLIKCWKYIMYSRHVIFHANVKRTTVTNLKYAWVHIVCLHW